MRELFCLGCFANSNQGGQIMLHEIDAYFAASRTSAQAADRHCRIGKQGTVAGLDNQTVEELKSAPARFNIIAITLFLAR